MSFQDPKHPFWSILKMVVVNSTCLTLIFMFRANRFDMDEIKNIGTFIVVITGALGAIRGIEGRTADGGPKWWQKGE